MKRQRAKVRKMTVKDFFQRYAKLFTKGWQARFVEDACFARYLLRLKRPSGRAFCFCPITAIYRELTGVTVCTRKAYFAGRKIGLSGQLIADLIESADGIETMRPSKSNRHLIYGNKLIRSIPVVK